MDPYKVTKEYYNQKATEHIEQTKPYNWSAQISKFTKLLKGKRILDAGCGGGRDIKEFLKLKLEPEGLDYSHTLIDICKKLFPKTKFYLADLQKTNLPDEYYDGIWACASILHLTKQDARKAMKEFSRLLKKKGILFISVKKGKGEKLYSQPGRERFFAFYSKKEIMEVAEKTGFKVLETKFSKYEELTGKPKLATDHDWLCIYAEKLK